jgi:NitT/TauT family transport system permease protein
MIEQLIEKLFVDTGSSWVRMSIALVLSIIFSWIVGIAAARNKTAEKIIIPALDVLQSVPILALNPFQSLARFYSYPESTWLTACL